MRIPNNNFDKLFCKSWKGRHFECVTIKWVKSQPCQTIDSTKEILLDGNLCQVSKFHKCIYVGLRMYVFASFLILQCRANEILRQFFSLTFCLFWPPYKETNDTKDISFESPYIGLLEFKKKLEVASSWRWPHPIY